MRLRCGLTLRLYWQRKTWWTPHVCSREIKLRQFMEGCSGVRSSSSERFTADFMNIDSFQIQIYFQAFCLLSNSQPCSVRPVPGAHMLWGRQSDRNGCGLLAVPLSSRLHYVCDWDITYLYWGTPDTAAYLWEYMHAGPGGLRTPAITEASAPAKGTLLNGGETAFWMKLALHSAATIRNWCPSYCNIFSPHQTPHSRR